MSLKSRVTLNCLRGANNPLTSLVMHSIGKSYSEKEVDAVMNHPNWKDNDEPFMEISSFTVNGVELSVDDWAQRIYSGFDEAVKREVNKRMESHARPQIDELKEKLDQLSENLDEMVRDTKPSWMND